MSELKFHNPSFLPRLPGFAWCADDGDTVHIAGHLAVDNELRLVEESFEAQCQLSFENLKRCLEDVGCTERDLVHMTVYLVPDPDNPGQDQFMADCQTMMAIKNKVMPNTSPAGTFVRVPGLFFERQRIEVTTIARRQS